MTTPLEELAKNILKSFLIVSVIFLGVGILCFLEVTLLRILAVISPNLIVFIVGFCFVNAFVYTWLSLQHEANIKSL